MTEIKNPWPTHEHPFPNMSFCNQCPCCLWQQGYKAGTEEVENLRHLYDVATKVAAELEEKLLYYKESL
jgi:hypothetical protein